jgi:hypothetical protein
MIRSMIWVGALSLALAGAPAVSRTATTLICRGVERSIRKRMTYGSI